MKVVLFAGGFGSRLSEETAVRPKPMVEIGEQPMLWHIMKIYAYYGMTDFIVCCGHKGNLIKDYFASYALSTADVTFDLRDNTMELHGRRTEPWRVTLVDTGIETMTGGRLRRVREHIGAETFCLTYGDALAAIDVRALIDFHVQSDAAATVTAVQPPGRFGALAVGEDSPLVESFREKPSGDGGWVNGGFFVLEPEVFDYIEGDGTVWEREPLERLAQDGQLAGYRHTGYWQNMDTLRDKMVLEEQWATENPPWKVW